MRSRHIWVFALLAAAASTAACADLLGFKDLHEGEAGAPDTGAPPDAGGDAGADVDTCAHASWPVAPTADDPGGDPDGGGSMGYVFAMHHVYFVTAPDGGAPSFGYDLDHRCTTDPSSASCTPPAGADSTTVVDGVGGVDSQSIHLMQQLGTFVPSLTDQSLSKEIENGQFTILMRLFSYHGVANQTAGSGLLFGIQGSPGTNGAPATFGGNDQWLVASDDTLGGSRQVPNKRTSAYVKGDTLVATYASPVTLRVLLPSTAAVTGPLAVTLDEATLTARLVQRGDGRYDLHDGVVTGRWPIDAMLQAVAQLNLNNSPLCSSTAIYQSVQGTICSQRDIVSDATKDNTGAACDAISVAIAFDAVAANVSGSAPFPPITTPCDAGACP